MHYNLAPHITIQVSVPTRGGIDAAHRIRSSPQVNLLVLGRCDPTDRSGSGSSSHLSMPGADLPKKFSDSVVSSHT